MTLARSLLLFPLGVLVGTSLTENVAGKTHSTQVISNNGTGLVSDVEVRGGCMRSGNRVALEGWKEMSFYCSRGGIDGGQTRLQKDMNCPRLLILVKGDDRKFSCRPRTESELYWTYDILLQPSSYQFSIDLGGIESTVIHSIRYLILDLI